MKMLHRRIEDGNPQQSRSDSSFTLRPPTPHQVSEFSTYQANSHDSPCKLTQRKILERCLSQIPSERQKEVPSSGRSNASHFDRVYISKFACRQILSHAIGGQENEVIGMLIGTTIGSTFIVTRTFRVPAVGTETRVNAQAESYEYMVQYMNDVVGNGDDSSEAALNNIVGWYHSHPGYDCWLSGIDMQTQDLNQSFQDPYLAIVVDPLKSLESGEISIGAFRTCKKEITPDVLNFYELPLYVFESELNHQINDGNIRYIFQQLDETYESSLIDSLMESMKQYNNIQYEWNMAEGRINSGSQDSERDYKLSSQPRRHLPGDNTMLHRDKSQISLNVTPTNIESGNGVEQDSSCIRKDTLGNKYGSECTTSEVNSVPTLSGPIPGEHITSRDFISRNLETLVTGNIIPEMTGNKNIVYHAEAPDSEVNGHLNGGCKDDAKKVALKLQLNNLFSLYLANKSRVLKLKKRELEDLKFYRDAFSL